MISKSIGHRNVSKGSQIGVLALSLAVWGSSLMAAEPAVVIKATTNRRTGQTYFDPLCVYIKKGETVRWESTKRAPTVTAFHPSNTNHELRIPENARPFDSGILSEPPYGHIFEWTFDVEGTYDYFSRNHEITGMVGRIVVGTPGGPAEKHPPGYGGREGRALVYPAQARALNVCDSQSIVENKAIPFPSGLVVRSYRYGDQ